MPLLEELTESGQWLFRWRSYLPLVLVALFVTAVLSDAEAAARVEGAWLVASLAVSGLGLLVRVLTAGQVPGGTSGRNTRAQAAASLNTTGIYATCRNPLYFGNYLMGLGIAIATGLWWMAVIFTLCFWLFYERVVFAEEAFLLEKFGGEYLEWASRTPVFVPDPRRYSAADLSFSPRTVLRREYNTLLAVVVLHGLLEVARRVSVDGAVTIDGGWRLALALAVVVSLTLRTLRLHTKVLDVAGR